MSLTGAVTPADRLRSLREQRGYTQERLSQDLLRLKGVRVTREQVLRLESGRKAMSVDVARALCCVLGVSWDGLLGGPAAVQPSAAAAVSASPSLCETRAVAALGAHLSLIREASRLCWGHWLPVEREARTGKGPARGTAMRRAHVTRQLYKELAERLASMRSL